MGYAILISTARPIIEDLMETPDADEIFRGRARISWNFLHQCDERFVRELQYAPREFFVAQVYSGTGAEAAGLVRGNIVVAFDGVTVQNQEELIKQMQYYKAGGER